LLQLPGATEERDPKKHKTTSTTTTTTTTTAITTPPPPPDQDLTGNESRQGKNKGQYAKDVTECNQQGCIALPGRKVHLKPNKLQYTEVQAEKIAASWSDFIRLGKTSDTSAKSKRFHCLSEILSIMEECSGCNVRELWIHYLHARISQAVKPEVHESRWCWEASGTPDTGNQGVRLALPNLFLVVFPKTIGKDIEGIANGLTRPQKR